MADRRITYILSNGVVGSLKADSSLSVSQAIAHLETGRVYVTRATGAKR